MLLGESPFLVLTVKGGELGTGDRLGSSRQMGGLRAQAVIPLSFLAGREERKSKGINEDGREEGLLRMQ